jgi:hypothetical protein
MTQNNQPKVQVLMQYECHYCMGTGDDPDITALRFRCPVCDGIGFVDVYDSDDWGGIRHELPLEVIR